MSQAIILCADDYGHTAAVSRAILDLAGKGRISALSCMTASPFWREHGRWLKDAGVNADIGLHITLVDEAPLTSMPHTAPSGRLPNISTLIRKSYLRQLDLAEIAGEVRAQREAFEDVMGFSPHHLDGHLHTHVLPGIRDVTLRMAREMRETPWIRNINDRLIAVAGRGVAAPKAAFLSALGGGLWRQAGALRERMNQSFSGVYAFTPQNTHYGSMFEHFVTHVSNRHTILCHPGGADDDAAHAPLRAGEYAFLNSSSFADLLARRDLKLGRFADLGP